MKNMHTRLRTVAAFLVAPSVAGILVGIAGASTRKQVEGLTWLLAFWQYFVAACIGAYALSYTLGTLTFVALRIFNRESIFNYTFIGAILGMGYGLVIASVGYGSVLGALGLVGFFSFVAGSVALVFAILRGKMATNKVL